MGAGIATGFRDRYPEMFAEYRRRCKASPASSTSATPFCGRSRPALGVQPGHAGGRLAGTGQLRGHRGRPGEHAASRPTARALPASPSRGSGPATAACRGRRCGPSSRRYSRTGTGTLYVYEEFRPEGTEQEDVPAITMIVESRRKKRSTIEEAWPGALILDVTSKGEEPWVQFSPFYPHGGIPVPHSPDSFAQSVEGLWQGLKVFENEDIDASRWQITDLKGIKRAGRTRGQVRGHRFGVDSDVLLGYRDARYLIYLPAYRWVLENRLAAEVKRLPGLRLSPDGCAPGLRDERRRGRPVPAAVPRRPGEVFPGGKVADRPRLVIGIQFRSTLGIQSKSTNSTTLACGADAAAGGRGCALWTILPGFDKPTETG